MSIRFSSEYAALTSEIKKIHDELVQEYPGRFYPTLSILDLIDVATRDPSLKLYSGTELIEIIAHDYCSAVESAVSQEKAAEVHERLMQAVYPKN